MWVYDHINIPSELIIWKLKGGTINATAFQPVLQQACNALPLLLNFFVLLPVQSSEINAVIY